MKHIVLSSVLFVTSVIIPNWYLNAWYLDWDCNNRDTIPEMNAFIEEKAKINANIELEQKEYFRNTVKPAIDKFYLFTDSWKQYFLDTNEVVWFSNGLSAAWIHEQYIRNQYQMENLDYVHIKGAWEYEKKTASWSAEKRSQYLSLIEDIKKAINGTPKLETGYESRNAIRDACVKKFADIDKKNELTAEQKAKEDEVRKIQETERAKINATAQKEQEEAEIRALTKKKLEIELEALSKGKWESTSSGALKLAPTLEQNKAVINDNISKAFEEYGLLKTSREKNSFIGKRTVALKRELRKADKARVKEIINEMRELKNLQK